METIVEPLEDARVELHVEIPADFETLGGATFASAPWITSARAG